MTHRCLTPILALLASACMSVPRSPPMVAPGSATGGFATLPVASIAPVPDDWWRLYDDPVLDGLVRSALAANADLRVAYANLDAARAALRQARAARLPQTTIESALGVDNPASQPSASGNVPTTDYDIAATASWDLDLFGRLRSAATAAGADAGAQAAVVDGLRVAVVADTVLAYVDLCGSTRAIAAARAVATAQDRSVGLVREQLRAGEVSPLEVSQVATIAAATRAAIAPFEAQRANALYRLATLQGRPPAEARDYSFACTAAPRLRTAAAKATGKPVEGLETFDQQLGYLADMAEPLQIKYLVSVIDDYPKMGSELDKMVARWAAGDPDGLAEVMNESLDETPELAKVLLTDRNARWTDWIVHRLEKPGTVFIAVGAAHLAGQDSVVSMLAKRRHQAVRVAN